MTIPGNSPGGGRHSYYPDTLPTRLKPSETIKKMFATSPQYDGSYGQQQIVDTANAILAAGTIGTGGEGNVNYMFPEGVKMDYQDSPDIRTVQWTIPGDPSTPYTPDLRSPGVADGVALNDLDGNPVTNFQSIESAPGDEQSVSTLKPTLNVDSPENSTRSPADTSKLIAAGTALGVVLPNKLDGNWKGTLCQ